MGERTWLAFVIAGLAAALTAAASSAAIELAVVQVVGWTSVAVALVGLRARRPQVLFPWYCFAAAGSAFLLAGLARGVHGELIGVEQPFPSPVAEVLFVTAYGALLIGEVAFIRSRSTEREFDNLIDALIVGVSVGVVAWAMILAPYVRDGSVPLDERLLNVAYSSLTLLLLAVTTRVAVGPGARTPSYYLLAGSITSIFSIDFLVTLSATGRYDGDLAVVLAPIGYVLLAAAALHPSMERLTRTPTETRPRLTWKRMVLLAIALLMTPAVLVGQLTAGDPADLPVVVTGWVLLSLLVLVRLSGLVRASEQVADREQILRAATLDLVTATTSAQMHDSALRAAMKIVGREDAIRASIVSLNTDGDVVASIGRHREAAIGAELLVSLFTESELRAFENLSTVVLRGRPSVDLPAATYASTEPASVLIPLVSRGELRGAMVVTARAVPRSSAVRVLESLASELSLALESAALVGEIHRRESERRFRALVQYSSDVVAVVDSAGRLTYISPSVKAMLGLDPDEVLGQAIADVIDSRELREELATIGREPFAQFGVEVQIEDADGDDHSVDVTFTDLRGEESVGGIVINARDVTERKHLEHDLRHQALHDALTGLGNRTLFLRKVEEAIEATDEDSKLVAVLFVDLDDFKTINDSLGHAVGDELLIAVSERLRACLRSQDMAARLGGDEFAVLVHDPVSDAHVKAVAERMLSTIHQPFRVQGREISTTISIGIHLDRDGARSAEDALRNADTAMYRAKDAGKDRFEIFEETMHAGVYERLELKADLARGLAEGQLILHYQPIVELRTGRVRGVEALVRWHHPERGLLPPAMFVPLAEDAGLIVSLGRWVLREACHQAAAWSRGLDAENEMSVSVNLSVRQLQEVAIVEDVASALRASELDPRRLVLEITESVLMADAKLAIARLDALRSLGVRIAIDDFGTGYSSLGYVQQLPLDLIKIDRSFVDGLGVESTDGQVVHTVIDLARRLGVETVAEGIEEPVQLAALQALGCQYGQGFYFARPAPPEAIAELLADGAPIAATFGSLVRPPRDPESQRRRSS